MSKLADILCEFHNARGSISDDFDANLYETIRKIKEWAKDCIPKALEVGLQGKRLQDYHQEGFRYGNNYCRAETLTKIKEE